MLSSKKLTGGKEMKGILYFDGAAKGNPGPAGIGYVLIIEKRKYTHSKAVGEKTNNQAEYLALIEGMKKAKELGVKELVVKGDSQLVIRQMEGKFKVKNANVKPLFKEAKELENYFEKVTYEWIPRKENKEADALANLEIE
ncbi:MAG: ribonuclease H [Aquifex sp.]|nr:MAG: ribonuclease H [Aquifex sp.]